MISTQMYSVTIHRDQQGGHGLLAQTHTSEPAINRGAFPCAPVGYALLSKRTAVLETSRERAADMHRNTHESNRNDVRDLPFAEKKWEKYDPQVRFFVK
jgi:hypothetical protein